MLNHKTKEAVASAFVRRLPTDVNDSTAKSGLGHEHNAHSVDAAHCILANRSANMPLPCRKSVRRECGSSLSSRRMTAALCFARGVFFGGYLMAYASLTGGAVLEALRLPFPRTRPSNLHGTALHTLEGVKRLPQFVLGARS